MKSWQQIPLNILLYSVFAFYLVILFGLLFMKAHSFSSINIVPFHSIGSYLFSDDKLFNSKEAKNTKNVQCHFGDLYLIRQSGAFI